MTNPVFLADELPEGAASFTLAGAVGHHAHVMRLGPGAGIDMPTAMAPACAASWRGDGRRRAN